MSEAKLSQKFSFQSQSEKRHYKAFPNLNGYKFSLICWSLEHVQFLSVKSSFSPFLSNTKSVFGGVKENGYQMNHTDWNDKES